MRARLPVVCRLLTLVPAVPRSERYGRRHGRLAVVPTARNTVGISKGPRNQASFREVLTVTRLRVRGSLLLQCLMRARLPAVGRRRSLVPNVLPHADGVVLNQFVWAPQQGVCP